MSGPRPRPPAAIAAPTAAGEPSVTTPPADPRAVRIGIAPISRLEGDPSFSLASSPAPAPGSAPGGDGVTDGPLVDGVPARIGLQRFDGARARFEEEGSNGTIRTAVLFGPIHRDRRRGAEMREVVVEGWRVEVEVEPERRAVLRERARRGAGAASKGGPVEVRAIIPGRVVAISVVPGDDLEAGQQILVVEAMKMQNELRSPREGTVERVAVAAGATIEVGDLLVVIR